LEEMKLEKAIGAWISRPIARKYRYMEGILRYTRKGYLYQKKMVVLSK